MSDEFYGWLFGTVAAWLVLGIIVLMLLWGPLVGPWVQERKGLANLQQAQQERKILIEQASAEKESATLRAEAIAIVGKATKEFPEYRQQEYIGAFAEALTKCQNNQIIYIPTEASIPLLEAQRLTAPAHN